MYRSDKFEIERLASNSASNDDVLGGGRNSRGRIETSGKLYAVTCKVCGAKFRATKAAEETPGKFTSGAGWVQFTCINGDAEESITNDVAP
jgi:RNase P subunit RPR2